MRLQQAKKQPRGYFILCLQKCKGRKRRGAPSACHPARIRMGRDRRILLRCGGSPARLQLETQEKPLEITQNTQQVLGVGFML